MKKTTMDDLRRSKADLIKELQELRLQNQNYKNGSENQPNVGLHTEMMLQKMIAHSPISIQLLDKDGISISVNDAHTKFFDAKPPDHYNLFKDPLLLKQGLTDSFRKLQQGEAVFFPDTWYNAHILDKSFPDKEVWLKTCGISVPDDKGKPHFYIIMHEDISERKKLTNELEEKNKSLRILFDSFQLRIEEVRKNLAAELHDNLIQDLTAHKIKLAVIRKKFANEQINEELRKETLNVNNMIRTARNILTILWPTVIDNQGIEAALESHSETFSNKYHIKVIRDIEKGIVIPKNTAYQLFMIFQEALINIAKHSKSRTANIILKQEMDHIHFVISDNGKGINEKKVASKKTFGLLMMKDITTSLGGVFRILKNKEKGTLLDIVIPLNNTAS